MSKKSTRTGPIKTTPKAPRPMAEIQAEYAPLVAKAGQLQYQVAVQTHELESLNVKLQSLNREANARQEADKAAKPEETVADVQS